MRAAREGTSAHSEIERARERKIEDRAPPACASLARSEAVTVTDETSSSLDTRAYRAHPQMLNRDTPPIRRRPPPRNSPEP